MVVLTPALQALATQMARGPRFLLLGAAADLLDFVGEETVRHRWSGVYTSATTRAVMDAFVTDNRTASAQGPVGRTPTRSRTELEVRYLFGADHLPDADRETGTALGKAKARVNAIQGLSTLVEETVTPRGTVLIDGWRPGDRLEVADAAPVLAALAPDQAHLFSADVWAAEPTLGELAADGRLVLHPESLEEALSVLADAGALTVDGGDQQHVIRLGTGFAAIDVHTWNDIRRSSRPVDLELLKRSVFSSEAARYHQFREFTGAAEGTPRWRAIADGMVLRRDFQDDVAAKVREMVDGRDLPGSIVIEGQTATGKSVAMAMLAADFARTGDVAVLHQARGTVRPAMADIDRYAAWAERRGARATVLFWDGMSAPADYEALARQLRARGRRVVVVGSTYLRQRAEASTVVTAPALLSAGEFERLHGLLRGFAITLPAPAGAVDASFLAVLYRFLPETERQLRRGLSEEMRAAERGMEQLVRKRDHSLTEAEQLTAVQQAFLAAGVSLVDLLPQSDADVPIGELAFADRGVLQRVTTLVLVAGCHGVPVPIDLVLRVLGREGSRGVREALDSTDIIREIDDDDGELFLSARSRLEAELLARQDIPLDVQAEVIVEIIERIRVSHGTYWGADEVQFLVSLLDRIGPNADQPQYKRYFGDIAEALRTRRLALGRAQPRLALQESLFTRGAVKWLQSTRQGSPAQRVESLERNNEMLVDVLSEQRSRGMMRLALTVELASSLGAIVYEGARHPADVPTAAWTELLDDIRRAVLDARAIDPGNIYPVDVLAWTTRDAVKTGALNPAERLGRLADALAMVDSLDRGSLTKRQRANLDGRGAELNKALHDDKALTTNLAELERNDDPAATYLLARLDTRSGPAGAARALTRLQDAPAAVRRDWRCAQLLIELTWTALTGTRLLRGEREPIHLTAHEASALRALAADLDASVLPEEYKLRFALAVADFADGRFDDARRGFRDVEDLTRQQTRRIKTVYVLADADGRPRVFTGRVESADSANGEVWVEELGTRVRFDPRLFAAGGDLELDQRLPAFVIGFKLSRGATAEPRHTTRRPAR